jgi:hypothetical protein
LGFKSQAIQPLVNCYTDYTILAHQTLCHIANAYGGHRSYVQVLQFKDAVVILIHSVLCSAVCLFVCYSSLKSFYTSYQNAGRSHNIKIDNSSFERVEEFRYLGTALTNQNSIQEEKKSRLESGNACYHSVQNLLSSSLLSKNIKIKIQRNIIFLLVLYGCETW